MFVQKLKHKHCQPTATFGHLFDPVTGQREDEGHINTSVTLVSLSTV